MILVEKNKQAKKCKKKIKKNVHTHFDTDKQTLTDERIFSHFLSSCQKHEQKDKEAGKISKYKQQQK